MKQGLENRARSLRRGGVFLFTATLSLLADMAAGQEAPPPDAIVSLDSGPLLPGPASRDLPRRSTITPTGAGGSFTRNIMLTGYWPPTNEMLRRFSANPAQNPVGWIGDNWEGRGYDVYAFFPEFPSGRLDAGQGDFEIDYQDTSNDWWPLVEQLRPVAIITFSRAVEARVWELEGGNVRWRADEWAPDFRLPTRPTPELPIMQLPVGQTRFSSLPLRAIERAVFAAALPTVQVLIDPVDDGRFLSNYIGFHGCWYHDLHAALSDPAYNVAAGHIHVGNQIPLDTAIQGVQISLRTLITVTDRRLGLATAPADMNCDGEVSLDDLPNFVAALVGAEALEAAAGLCRRDNADCNFDGAVDFDDMDAFVECVRTRGCAPSGHR